MPEQGERPLFGEVDPKRYVFIAFAFAGMMLLFRGSETHNRFIFWLGLGIMIVAVVGRRLLYHWLRRHGSNS